MSFAYLDTHLPNAFRLFAFVPYLSANSCSPILARSALHFLAALSWLAGACETVAGWLPFPFGGTACAADTTTERTMETARRPFRRIQRMLCSEFATSPG